MHARLSVVLAAGVSLTVAAVAAVSPKPLSYRQSHVSRPQAVFHPILGGDGVWINPPATIIMVDGKQTADGDVNLEPGAHHIIISYAFDEGSLRAGFQFNAIPGTRYQAMFSSMPNERLKLWIANADTLKAVTTTIERGWIPGPDLPLLGVAQYPMPDTRFDCAAVGDADAIYLVGGKRWHTVSNSASFLGGKIDVLTDIVRFDLKTHESRTLTQALGRRNFQNAVLAGGKIYVLGAEDSLSAHSHSMQIYDLAAQRLSYGPAMPRTVSGFGAAVVKNRLYVTGGWSPDPGLLDSNAHPATNAVDYFDFAKQSWEEAPPMPTGAQGKATPLAGGLVFAGGVIGLGTRVDARSNALMLNTITVKSRVNRRNFQQTIDVATEGSPGRLDHLTEIPSVQFLDGATGAWSSLPPLTEPAPTRAAAVLDNRLFIFDDRDDGVQIYDPTNGQASTFHLRASRPGSTAVAVGDQIYIVGGEDSRGGSRAITVFKMNPNWSRRAEEAHPLP